MCPYLELTLGVVWRMHLLRSLVDAGDAKPLELRVEMIIVDAAGSGWGMWIVVIGALGAYVIYFRTSNEPGPGPGGARGSGIGSGGGGGADVFGGVATQQTPARTGLHGVPQSPFRPVQAFG